MNNLKTISTICEAARQASGQLALFNESQKNKALDKIVEQLSENKSKILTLNATDVAQAHEQGKPDAFIDRLTLTPDRYDAMLKGIQMIIEQPDPVGKILASWSVPSELQISKVSVPLGVIAVIYEARPNVTVDAAILCFKSGNAAILRGGSECARTNKALCSAIQVALKEVTINPNMIQYIPDQSRETLKEFLKRDDMIDVVIPRGGRALIEFISKESNIPTFKHLEGICHTYVHHQANLKMSQEIILNAKLRRPGICGATETLLIDEECVKGYLPTLLEALISSGCEIRGDQVSQDLNPRVKPATEDDWSSEYLDSILAVKVVKNIEEAIKHINTYGSSHTDAIITDDEMVASKFLMEVNSANVMHNCSTQFADGAEFGMGAEIGISTGKLHARGPVGLEQLTTFKYVVRGSGQVRT